jgi:Phosphotransferase enzyme family
MLSGKFYGVLPDLTGQRIALVCCGDSYQLPEFQREAGTRFNTVATVNEAVRAAWGMRVTVARCLAEGSDEKHPVFVLQNHDGSSNLPAEVQWVEISRLKERPYASPMQRQHILDWLLSEQDETWKLLPWSSSAWLAKVTNWIDETVNASGASVTGELKQVRTWAISSVYRVETTEGTLYFKALPDLLGHEPRLTQYMLRQFPQNVPDVIAIEANEHWMLTKEMGGPEPESRADWELVLRTLIRIQNHCKQNHSELLKFGVNDRPLAKLPELLEPVSAELKQAGKRAFYEVDQGEAEVLARRLRALPDLCARLAQCGIPDTLIHGDLWGPNVIMRDQFSGKSPIIFDWTDAAFSHPFFDIFCLLWAERNDAKRRAAREVHINVWSDFYPRQTVIRALELAEQIAPHYYLLAWRNVELHAPVHSRWELMYLVLKFVRKILAQSGSETTTE